MMRRICKLGGIALVLAAALLLVPTARAEEAPGCVDALFELGVLRGDGDGLAADRAFRRDEAAVMLVRLLGAEAEALEQNYESPFYDVDDWAKPYVGYLWENGLTKGVAEHAFAPAAYADGRQYITFLLRTLGYDDGTDFEYFNAEDFLVERGFFESRDDNEVWWYFGRFDNPFRRAECVELTVRALGWLTRAGDYLADRLIEQGVFTDAALTAALTPLRNGVGLDVAGRVVHGYIVPDRGNTIALPALGISGETYAALGWVLDGYAVAFDDDGASWFVDSETLARKCRMSEHQAGLVSYALYGGYLYFYEYPAREAGEPLNVCRYDGDETVDSVLSLDNAVYYDFNSQTDLIELVESKGGRSLYYAVDVKTGRGQAVFSAPGVPYASRFYIGENDGYTLLTVRGGTDVTYALLGGQAVLDTVEIPNPGMLHADAAPMLVRAESAEVVFFLDGSVVLCVTQEETLTVIAEAERAVRSVCMAGETLYLLTADELLTVENGQPRILTDILRPLGITDIDYADASGVYLTRREGVGMQHFDLYTYRYDPVTDRVEVVGFTPGRYDGDMRETIAAMEQAMRAAVEALYDDGSSD